MEKKIGKNVSSGAEKVETVAHENKRKAQEADTAPAKKSHKTATKKSVAKKSAPKKSTTRKSAVAKAEKEEKTAAKKRLEKAKAKVEKKERKAEKKAALKEKKLEIPQFHCGRRLSKGRVYGSFGRANQPGTR